MRLRVFLLVTIAATVGVPAAAVLATTQPTPPPVTINEFLPEERGLGECISAIPKPGCGSKARGGWRQGLVLLAILVGLALIAWRIVAGAMAAKRQQTGAV